MFLHRTIITQIVKHLEKKAFTIINGARQTGKTTLAKCCRADWKYFDLEKGSDFDFITTDFDLFFREYPQHLIIDEAQESAQIFRELRGVIDENRQQKNR